MIIVSIHSIHIEGGDIMDFSAFDKIRYVDGSFYVGDCDLIDSISSFNQLDPAGGRLTFTSMDNLVYADVFNSLTKTGGGLYVNHHQKLDAFRPFTN